ncbi:hypothetical protein NE237_029564 [Protea cynaroides]|uniref:Uncharacterized protein n=1 Tax=Protea cynaroides TaxID=273540 RepID=A0A9Q0GRF4_9MAGN|nr:hypothetical protein NE237_029564 [Protea cynaroides]
MDNLPDVEDASGAVIQRKGCFKVTSADLITKSASSSCLINPVCGVSSSLITPTISATSVLPSLQYILQLNTKEMEQIINVIKYVEQSSDHQAEFSDAGSTNILQIFSASAREKELQAQVVSLQQSNKSLLEDLQRLNMVNAQLERHLNALQNKQDEGI